MESRLSLPIAGDEPRIEVYGGDILADVFRVGTVKRANEISGGLSQPMKMPEYSFNLPSSKCRTGGRLKEVEGSVCFSCYSADDWDWVRQSEVRHGTRYPTDNVREAMRRRYEGLVHPEWVPALVYLIQHYRVKHFRWHDSGDVASVEHQLNIFKVAEHTPQTRFWQPSREIEIVREALRRALQPTNHILRMSAHMIGGKPPRGFPHTSMVIRGTVAPEGSVLCPAPDQEGQCKGCRHCWEPEVQDVSYRLH